MCVVCVCGYDGVSVLCVWGMMVYVCVSVRGDPKSLAPSVVTCVTLPSHTLKHIDLICRYKFTGTD